MPTRFASARRPRLSRPVSAKFLLAAAVAAVLSTAPSATAETYAWMQTTGGPFNWDNAEAQDNWSLPGFPNGVGDVANVTSDLSENAVILLNVPITLGQLNLGDADGTHSFALLQGTLGSLHFDNGAFLAQITQQAFSFGDTISVPVTTRGDLIISNFSSNSLVFEGPLFSDADLGSQMTVTVDTGNVRFAGDVSDGITGSSVALMKSGSGTLSLLGNNTFTGGVTLDSGVLNIGSATALGAPESPFLINGGTLSNSGADVTIANGNQQIWAGDFTFTGPANLNLGTGPVILNGSRQINVTAGTLQVDGTIFENGVGLGISKIGAGTLSLSGANEFSGPVSVTGGILGVRHASALGSHPSPTVSVGGTLMLDGGITVTGKTLAIAGDGAPTQLGALRSVNGDNVWAGDLQVNTSLITRIVAGSGTLTINGNIFTSGTAANGLVFQGSGVVNGQITGDASVTRSNNDPGIWTFNGANTHTGVTTISNGALQMGHANALTNSPLTLNSVFTNGLRFSPGIGTFHLVSLTGATAASTITLQDSDAQPVTLSVGSAGTNTTFAGQIHGSGGLAKVGNGILTLSGASTFSGGLALTAGAITASDATVVTGSASNVRNGLGAGPVVMDGGSILNLRPTGTSDSSQQILTYGNNIVPAGPATITVDRAAGSGTNKIAALGHLQLGADVLTVTSGNNYSLSFAAATLQANATIASNTATGNVILGNVAESGGPQSLTKLGSGRLTIAGEATHTGGTIVSAGTLQVGLGGYAGTLAGNVSNETNVTFNRAGSSTYAGQISGPGTLTKTGSGTVVLTGANSYTGTTTLSNGTLTLDFATAPSVLSASSALVLGGTLHVKGAPTGTTSQTLGSFTGPGALASKIIVDNNGGDGTTLTLGNSWTFNSGNALHVDLSRGGTLLSSPTLSSNVIVGGAGATVARVAVTNTSGRTYIGTVIGGAVAPLTATTALTASSSSATTNFHVSGDVVTDAAVAAATLRIDTTAGPGSLDLNGDLTFGRTALLMDGEHDFEIKTTSGTGRIANVLIQQYGTGALIYSAPIISSGFTKAGPGLLIGNMSNGPASPSIIEGVYRVAVPTAIPTGTLTLAGGILELASGDYTSSVGAGANQVRITADGGFSAFGDTRVVNLGGAAGNVTWDQQNFLPNNATLLLSSPHSNALLDFQNPLLLGGLQRTVRVDDGSAPVDAQLSGTLQGTGELVKTGLGTLALTAANPFTGTATIRDGTLAVNGSLAGSVRVESGTLQGGGDGFTTGIIGGAIFVGDGLGVEDAILSPGNGLGKLTTSSALSFSSDAQFKFELDSAALLTDEIVARSVSIVSGATFLPLELGIPTALVIGQPFVVIHNTSEDAISGTFANLPEGGTFTVGLNTFQASYAGGDGNDFEIVAVVPEPSSIALLLGAAALVSSRRTRKVRR